MEGAITKNKGRNKPTEPFTTKQEEEKEGDEE
jgi:hypothetical protein